MSALDQPPFLDALREEFARVAEADAQAGASAPRRSPWLRLAVPRVALPVVCVLLALLVGVGVTASGLLSSGPDRGDQVAVEGDYAASLQRSLSLLRQAPEPPGTLPAGLAQRGFSDEAIRLSPPTPASGSGTAFDRRAWVLPALDDPDRLLLVTETPRGLGGSPTVDTAGVRAGSAYIYVEATDGGIALVGLAPNGVDRVTVRTPDERIELPVRDNTFGAVLPDVSTVHGVSWSGMGGP